MKKIFVLCVILTLCSSCSEFALLASGSSLAVSQSSYARAYNGVDLLTIMGTKKSIKKHAYEKGKKYIYEKAIDITKH
mgnify:CR=1 FL=1